jgi:hypothetical protein
LGICSGADCKASTRRLYPELRLSILLDIPLILLVFELSKEEGGLCRFDDQQKD